MGGVRRRKRANLLGSVVLVATLAALALGLPAVDRMLPGKRAVSSDVPYLVGSGVTVVPPPGVVIDVTATRPDDSGGTVLFLLGSVRYAIRVAPFEGTLPDAAARLRQRITGTTGYQVAGPETRVATPGGLAGVKGGYTAPGRGGRYAVFVTAELAIEVTVSGPEPELHQRLPAVERSIGTIIIGADR